MLTGRAPTGLPRPATYGRIVPHVSPLPSVDLVHAVAFWARFTTTNSGLGLPMPTVVAPFGDSVELANELVGLIGSGLKRATAGAILDYERANDPLPVVGSVSIATDGTGQARAVLRTTEVRVGPLSSVDEQFAWDEGEGDRTRATWLDEHERFFRRYLPTLGLHFDPEMAVVFERFELMYWE